MGEIRLHGRGGQGTVIAAEMLANAFVFGGKYASVFPSFGVERRGSAVMAFARFGEKPIRERTRVYRPDILLMFDESLTEVLSNYDGFKSGGMIIANTKHEQNVINLNVNQQMLATVDGVGIALEETGTPITNTCMMGAFASATGLVKLDDLRQALGLYFTGTVLAKNLRSLERGYKEVKVTHFDKPVEPAPDHQGFDTDYVTIKPPQFTSTFDAAWDDVDKKLITTQTGGWRYKQPQPNQTACRLCGWCSIYCPAGSMKLGQDGYYHPDLNYCKGCGICANQCPAHAIMMKAEEVL
ncbi:2-oxoacid:acceptor oxidoreductase family protein [Sporomusa sp.]|uniref:2-oxoacid:acceptor oxidoreductase family protein n=1 Tax=Sporomusa sp. TaxID=2078658 RepID=UPI002BF1E2E1|nr:2-oxoacid:acceptor oxidoreductase family protein [Sporomusa sp.]HWR09467.1 2-oxoacid:acceptor oxidoreductase family protein [Sporomusa sp.]